MSSSCDSRPEPTKSLQVLCEDKAIDLLQRDKARVEIFESLEPHQQSLLFARLMKDNERLQEVERQHNVYLNMCPPADRDLYNDNARMKPTPKSASITSDNEDAHAAIEQTCEYFLSKWKFGDGSASFTSTQDEIFDWEWADLVISPSPGRQITLRKCWIYPGADGPIQIDEVDIGTKHNLSTRNSISSQLLWYRICCVFGMPLQEPELMNEESRWSVELIYLGGCYGYLALYDYEGGISCYFTGTGEASDSALELLNWLVSNRIPNETFGGLAGTDAGQSTSAATGTTIP